MSDLNELFKEISNEHLSKLDAIISMGQHLSTESSTMAFIDSAKSKFYDYVGRVQNFIKTLKLSHAGSQHIKADELLTRYGQQDYSINRRLKFEVAPGFSGNLPDFLHLMQDTVLPAAEASEASLKVVITRMATLLNEPDRLKAQSGIRDMEQHVKLIDVKTLEKVKSYFKTGARGQVEIREVMDRNADMPVVYQLTNDISERLNKVDFKKVQGLVERLGDLTGSLNKQINDSGEGEREEVAGAVAGQLSDLFYRIGVTLTACSVLIELSRQNYEAMARNVDGVLGQLPKQTAGSAA